MEYKRTALVCRGTGCVTGGGDAVYKALKAEVEKQSLRDVKIDFTGCHGYCQEGPIVAIEPDGILYVHVDPEHASEIVTSHLRNGRPVERLLYHNPATGKAVPQYSDINFYKQQSRMILRNCGHINPENIDDYLAHGGYQSARKALLQMTPDLIIDEIKRAGLRGRGGAGFSTAVKWELCRKASGQQKYVICNADEGDPGAFMDGSILEADPHAVLEGLIIAAYAMGASEGYVYVRAEYPLAVSRLRTALQQSRERGYLGSRIMGSSFDFDIQIKEGAGAFVCGEETALMMSMEGQRGMPRPRPPFPAQSGLHGRPTNINNVKTLATVPLIIERGADWYAGIGTEKSKGTALFSLTGKVANCGLIEVPMGTPMSKIIFDIGGGIPRGKQLKAVQTGGPSGGCIPSRFMGVPVEYESLAKLGSIMGSGGMVVMDEDTCMVEVARYFLDFTQSESCGKCTPCRIGTKRLLEILTRITEGMGNEGDVELLTELAHEVKDTALCGLGQTAPNPVLTTIEYFRDEYDAHIREKRCPAAACNALVYAPCEHTCPLNVDAVGYVALIAEGKTGEALDLIREKIPLAGVCGRVCHHPCEQKCRRGEVDQPVAIAALKRFAADYGVKMGIQTRVSIAKPRQQKVAIVGSGPAGLNAAYHLARRGYEVTILEALPVAGGMLAVGIPNYRLPKIVLQADIDFITGLGVEIKLNTPLGDHLSLDNLFEQGYRAVLLATGAQRGRKLEIQGEELKGVLDGVSYLRQVNLAQEVAPGKRVAVIGGGNVAFDAARTSLRQGALEVSIVYRRSVEEMPASREEIEEGMNEGIRLLCMTNPSRITGTGGRVERLECIRTQPGEYEGSGRRRPVIIAGSEFSLQVDTVIVAIGQETDVTWLRAADGLDISREGYLDVDPVSLATSRAGVFAAGDDVTGPDTVTGAMASGEKAAISIDRYLRGENLTANRVNEKKTPRGTHWSEESVEDGPRLPVPMLPPEKGTMDFREVNLGLSADAAIREARRCLRCDLGK